MKAPEGKAKSLKFKNDGTFRIMQVADTQDTNLTSKNTIEFLDKVLDAEKPDLVVFTGDQIKGYGVSIALGDSEKNVAMAIKNIVSPVVKRNIPFTFVFGNHDDQAFGSSKDKQMAVYQSFPSCIAVSGDAKIDGYGNHFVNILSSDGTEVKFNIYLIDSLSASLDGHCSAVSESQLNWYRSVRDYLRVENGNYIPSMMFQHIPVPEMWEVLKEVPKTRKPHAVGYRSHYGKYYWMDEKYLISGNCDFLLETPATPEINGGEFSAVCEKGDVIAMFFGHDHSNSFISKYKDVILGYTQGCGFNVYGPDMNRGVRLIDLDEKNPRELKTHTVMYKDFFSSKDLHDKLKYTYYKYAPPSFESVIPLIKKACIAGAVTVTVGAAALYFKLRKDK